MTIGNQAAKKRSRAGLTLIEVLIAVSLVSMLSVGILMALRVGMSAMDKANRRLMDNRRAVGARRIIEEQLAGFIPVIAVFSPSQEATGVKIPFFEGRQQSMRFVSSYSLQEAARGMPQILEFQVIPGEQGRGVRLVVNENLYSGPRSAGVFCLGPRAGSRTGGSDAALHPDCGGSTLLRAGGPLGVLQLFLSRLHAGKRSGAVVAHLDTRKPMAARHPD